MQKLLTGEVATRLGLSAVRIRQLADAKRIPCERTVSGVRLFDQRDIDSFVAGRENGQINAVPDGDAAKDWTNRGRRLQQESS